MSGTPIDDLLKICVYLNLTLSLYWVYCRHWSVGWMVI